MRYLYTALFYLLLPLVFLRLLWRSRRLPAYRQRLKERLGHCPHKVDKSIWVHAVSVGESIAAIPLIKALKNTYPDLPILVTTMTPTGAERVKAGLGDTVKHAYVPYDLPSAIERFLNCSNPSILIVMETELWPNLFATCLKRHIPILVANARLSQKSAKGYASFWMKSLRHDMFAAIHHLAAQAHLDAERFAALGLPRNKIVVTGNLKFDLEMPDDLFQKTEKLHQVLDRDRLIWIAASTHPGEEEIILKAARHIRDRHPTALLILVPRHPDRFDSVAKLVEEQGFKMARRSRGDVLSVETEVYLGDTMGELLLLYSVVDIAFVAGSLVQVGGHNMLEPAALHKPIITGPVLYNFAEISQLLLDAKGMMIAKGADEIADNVDALFADADLRRAMGEHAYNVVAANRGALLRHLQLVKEILHT